jgi:hypothetical protein
MKNNNQVEVLLFSKYSFGDPSRKELVRWLGTTLQPVIYHQDKVIKKIFLRTLKNTPAIYLS